MKNKILLLGAGLFACILLFACSTQTNPEEQAVKMNEEKNKSSMNQIFNAFSTGNTAELTNCVDPNIVEHTPDPNIKETGIDGLKKAIEMYRGSFPDLKMNVLSMTADGDVVTSHYNMTGTNTGAMGEMPATNKSMNIDGVDIVRFENGKAVEHWGYFEEMKMMEQMGMMHDPAGMPMDPSAEMPK